MIPDASSELIPELEARLRDNPDDARSYYLLGYLYECFARDDKKAKHNYLNHLLRTLGHTCPDSAISDLTARIEGGGHDPIIHINLGEIYGYLNRFDESRAELKRGTVWTAFESEYYCIRVIRGSTAFHDAADILRIREKAFEQIVQAFQIDNVKSLPIEYYYYESRLHKGMMTGDQMPAHALSDMGEIHAVYSDQLKIDSPHEDAHIVLNQLGRPPKFIQEGAAEFFWQTEYNHSRYLDTKSDVPAEQVLNMFDDDVFRASDHFITYPLAASFVGFLVDEFGIETFKRYYSQPPGEPGRQFSNVFGLQLMESIVKWSDFLNHHNQ